MFLRFFTGKEGKNIFGFDRNGTRAHTTIGILGCCSGVGVTHLAISLCSYCASKQRKRTAFLELHARNEVSQLIPEPDFYSAAEHPLAKYHSADAMPDCPCFRLHGVDYYPRVTGREIPRLLNQGYDYLILDTGSLGEADLSEFLRCDRKLVIGSLTPWKLWTYEEFFHQFDNSQNLGEGFYYLVQTGGAKNLSHFSRAHHISMAAVPFIKNPFRIEKEHFLFLGNLLAEP